MAKKIELILENSNVFNKIFIPLVQQFGQRLANAGENVTAGTQVKDPDSKKIIFGAHSAPSKWASLTHTSDIIINLEPIYLSEWRDNNSEYIELLGDRIVYDYHEMNAPYLSQSAHFFPVPPLIKGTDEAPKMDCVFVGNVTPYRRKIIEHLKEKNLDVGIGFGVFGEELEATINNAKLFLSLNKNEQSVFSTFRFALCSATSTLYFGDSGLYDEHPEILPLIGQTLFEDADEMFSRVEELLTNEEMFRKLISIQHNIAREYQVVFNEFIKQQIKNGLK